MANCSFLSLPVELLLQICSFLDPDSLKSVLSVSKLLRDLGEDDQVWHYAFMTRFGRKPGFSKIAADWKSEYIKRSRLIDSYARGRGKNILFDGKIGTISHMFCDYSCARVTAVNIDNGLSSTSDQTTGKVAKASLYPVMSRALLTEVATVRIDKKAVFYGFTSGLIAFNKFSSSNSIKSFKFLSRQHSRPISALVSGAQLLQSSNTVLSLISGDVGGTIFFWNYKEDSNCLAQFDTGEGAIMDLLWDEHHSRLIVLKPNGTLLLLTIGRLDAIEVHDISADVLLAESCNKLVSDFPAARLFAAHNQTLSRIQRSTVSHHWTAVSLEHTLQGEIAVLAIDPTEHELDGKLPGQGGRLLCISDSHGSMAIFDTRSRGFKPIRFISTAELRITHISLNAVVIACGYENGLVDVYDVLTGISLKRLSPRLGHAQRDAETNAGHTMVQEISLCADKPKGCIAIGSQIRAFNWDPRMQPVTRKGRNAKGNVSNSGNLSSTWARPASRHLMNREVQEFVDQQREDSLQSLRLERVAGGLLHDTLSETELISYVQMISQEDMYDPLEEAFRRSLLDLTGASPDQATLSNPSDSEGIFMSGISSEDDHNLALALSMSLV